MATSEDEISQYFKKKDGPFFKSLEASMTTLHVQRQAFHGATFVGNHVDKLLKVVYNKCVL